MSLATVLVTGGAGFIASHVTAELLLRGHRVRVIDNFSTGGRENLGAVGGEVELIEGDIRSSGRTHAATEGVDCVIHLAAHDAGTQRVVMASSSSVYRRAQELPKTEALVSQPISPHGVSKLAAEQYCMGLNAVYGIEVAALRCFNVFGPRQDQNSQTAA
jgi:UDP-glucose 4-epimerase